MIELSPEHVFPSIRHQLKHFRRIVLGILLIAAVFAVVISFATLEKRVTAPGTVDGLRIYELKAPEVLTIVEVAARTGSRLAADAAICRATSFGLENAEERFSAGSASMEKLAKRYREHLTFRAPDAGIVLEAPRVGRRFHPGEVVVRFAADGEKFVTAHVSERMIHLVVPGMPARVKWTGGVIPAAVESVGIVPERQGKLASYPVRLRLNAPIAALRHGSHCKVEIITGSSRLISDLLGTGSRNNQPVTAAEDPDDAATHSKEL